jgi:hypothetical protein
LTNISEEHVASTFRAEEYAKQEIGVKADYIPEDRTLNTPHILEASCYFFKITANFSKHQYSYIAKCIYMLDFV